MLAGTGVCTWLPEQRRLQLSTPSPAPGGHAGLECQATFICKASWRRRLRKRAADPRWAVPQSLEAEPGGREGLLGPSGSKDFQEDGGLAGSPSFCELQAGALSREHVGRVGWAGVGEAESGQCLPALTLVARQGRGLGAELSENSMHAPLEVQIHIWAAGWGSFEEIGRASCRERVSSPV